jgi:hypothetical protein
MDGKENFICSDYDGSEYILKPMSDNGKRDVQYTANIKKLFNKFSIKFEQGENLRVFSVKRTEFKKLPPPTLLQRKCS